MSWNGPAPTFPGHPSDQSLQSAALAAAGPNPPSFPPDGEENKGETGGRTDRGEREGKKKGRLVKEGREEGGRAALSCHV